MSKKLDLPVPHEPRVLAWDIETDGLQADRVICIGWKWVGESSNQLFTYDGFGKNTPWWSDKKMLREFARVFGQCDMHTTWYGCPAPDQRVLTEDLHWVSAGDLVVGQRLVGFEATANRWRGRRRYQTATVVHVGRRTSQMLKITLDDGAMVKVSPEHPFMTCKMPARTNTQWVLAGALKPGSVIQRLTSVWEPDCSWGAGYLAGFFDGEGHLGANQRHVGACQKNNAALACVLEELDAREFATRNWHITRDDMAYVQIAGGKAEAMRFLGEIRPQRLLAKFKPEKSGNANTLRWQTVVSVEEYAGELVELSTDTETYVLEGFASHNSRFDQPVVEGRLIQHGLRPLPPKPHIDLWKLARTKLGHRRQGHRLQAWQDRLGLRVDKTPVKASVWIAARHGDKNALQYIYDHCRQDVRVLEEVYTRMRPWVENQPAWGLFTHEDGVCPSCGSEDVYREGFKVALTRVYQQWSCKACGRWWRGTKAVHMTNTRG